MHLPLAAWLLQAPLPIGGGAAPDPPAMSTTSAQEWDLGGVLRIKQHNFLRWQSAQDLRGHGHWHLVLQPIFLVDLEPLKPRWDRLVLSFASAPAIASGIPGRVNVRLQLRLPGTAARIGIDQSFVGGYQSLAEPRQAGSAQAMRGGTRATFSLPF